MPEPESPSTCPSNPLGYPMHDLDPNRIVEVGRTSPREFPCGTWYHVVCRHCKRRGTMFVADHVISWRECS